MDKFVAKYCFEYMSNKRLSVTHKRTHYTVLTQTQGYAKRTNR